MFNLNSLAKSRLVAVSSVVEGDKKGKRLYINFIIEAILYYYYYHELRHVCELCNLPLEQ